MIWLLSEIVLPIVVAGIVGLCFGAWVANRYYDRKVQERDAQIARLKLERDNAAANRPAAVGEVEVAPVRTPAKDESSRPQPIKLDDERVGGRTEPTLAKGMGARDTGGARENGIAPEKPDSLSAPLNNKPDNLMAITGIGPKIADQLNDNGIYHYDQIARWNEANVAWVDSLLKFKGRVAREKWVEQAQELVGDLHG